MENFDYVKELCLNKEELFINNFDKIMSILSTNEIYMLFKDKNVLKVIVENDLFFKNFKFLAKKTNDLYPIFYDLYEYEHNYIFNNIEKIIKYQFVDCGIISSYYDKFFDFCNYIHHSFDNIIDYVDNNINLSSSFDVSSYIVKILCKKYKESVIRNIDFFIEKTKYPLYLKKILKDNNYDKSIIDKIDNKIDNNIDKVIYEILDDQISFYKIKNDRIMDFLKIVIKELCEYEKVKYHDISRLSSGAYSNAVSIGNKVLKIGQKRHIFNIKNNKRFLKPLYRNEIKKDNEVLFCIEITELVDTENITLEDVYSLYKELRDKKLVWTDCKEDNIGRLIKDNKIYFNDIDKVDKVATSYQDDNFEILKAGDLVIIDNDYIYDEDYFFQNEDQIFIPSENFEEFETRYQEEKINNRKK